VTLLFPPSGPTTVTDPAGVVWNVAALYGVVALAGIFTMGAFSLLAVLRLVERAASPPTAKGAEGGLTAAGA